MKINLQIKPLSVNEAWQGKRFKTQKYKSYEHDMLLMLPNIQITDFRKLKITYGFSNKASDIDNPTKMVLDILQKKYGINDRDIEYLVLHKTIVKKGKEFIEIWLYE
jgi:Holliday junction resolvase RusA-like endonuclease